MSVSRQFSKLVTRREYLMFNAIAALPRGTSLSLAAEAVASTALAHPEWDMDEERTWDEWEAEA